MLLKNPIADKNFLLETDSARELYHDYAENMPIIDYHNHLDPKDIATDRQFKNLTEAWLHGDHYKWRAMRTYGVSEKYITGDADDPQKFLKWSEVVPHTVRNPLYHWTHMELLRYFGISDLLTPQTAASIYTHATDQLSNTSHSVQGLLDQVGVQVVCTTDDPADDLKWHQIHANREHHIKMIPCFRPDRFYDFRDHLAYSGYLEKLELVSGTKITTFDGLLEVAFARMDYFHAHGCRISDHGLTHLPLPSSSVEQPAKMFAKFLTGHILSLPEKEHLTFIILSELCKRYHELGWVQQFHLGAIRSNCSIQLKRIGVDAGFDSIGDYPQAERLSHFLDHLEAQDRLARTILYNLNPSDNEVFATMAGNFNDGSSRGKVQLGAAWWFQDQKDGIEKNLETLSNYGLLSTSLGMLTDSRSFLSFPRHDYYRRILCNLLGNDIKKGLIPADIKYLGQLVQNLAYFNTKNYFNF